MRTITRIAAVAIALAAGGGCARGLPPWATAPPSHEECASAARKSNDAPGSADFRWALTYGGLARCGDTGAVALAGALGRAGTIADTMLLNDVVVQASGIRHPRILEAALDITADRSAPSIARVAGMQVALRQHAVHVALPGGVVQLAVLEMGRLCRYSYLSGVGYASERPLPPGYRDTIVAAMRRIADDAAEPRSLDLAGCVASKVGERDR
ncbi:MAG TPA: hypothetical protein VLK84_22440 [Longimicrobium sp.]|nr:hypothetical protein [Longimicrobium sp.]